MPVPPPRLRFPEPSNSLRRGLSVHSQTLGGCAIFSSLLTHSLNAEPMLKQFLLFLREILVSTRRDFLNRPSSPLFEPLSTEESHRLRVASAIGIAPGLLEHFELSLDSGIGAQLATWDGFSAATATRPARMPTCKRNLNCSARKSPCRFSTTKSSLGSLFSTVASPVSRSPNDELELIFHLLEQVGLALRNIWLHDQLAGNHEMMTGVLRELSSACIVVGRDLEVLHANKAARRHFGRKISVAANWESAILPQSLGAKIYQVLRTGAAVGPFKFEPENSPGTVYSVSVVPFQRQDSAVPFRRC